MFNEGCVSSSEYIFVYREESTGLCGFAHAPSYNEAMLVQAILVTSGMTELGNKWRFQDMQAKDAPGKSTKEPVFN